MLIGEVLEIVPAMTAAESMANRLADRVRNLWLEHTKAGEHQWEDNFFEDIEGVGFLRDEAFPDLQGIDYIFQWWGDRDSDGLAGHLIVLWKVYKDGQMVFLKTTIRFAERDFVLGSIQDESRKREITRTDFRKAFSVWKKLYQEKRFR